MLAAAPAAASPVRNSRRDAASPKRSFIIPPSSVPLLGLGFTLPIFTRGDKVLIDH
jgi:hypothetical protein